MWTERWAVGKEGGLKFYRLLSTQQAAGDNKKGETRPCLLLVSQSVLGIPGIHTTVDFPSECQWAETVVLIHAFWNTCASILAGLGITGAYQRDTH